MIIFNYDVKVESKHKSKNVNLFKAYKWDTYSEKRIFLVNS